MDYLVYDGEELVNCIVIEPDFVPEYQQLTGYRLEPRPEGPAVSPSLQSEEEPGKTPQDLIYEELAGAFRQGVNDSE